MKCMQYFRYSHRLNACLLCLTLSLPLSAQPVPEGEDRTLITEIVRSIDVPGLQTGFQGIFVQSLKDGRVLFALHSEKTFVPASNNKLLTACIALEKLGANFVYRTRVVRDGHVDRYGALKGDLILVGSGDPALTPEALRSLAQQVRQSGIRRIRGAIRFDDTLFDAQYLGPGWAWDDEPFAYSAQISALNVHGNTVRLRVLPGERPGRPTTIQITPGNHYIRVINQTSTAPPLAKTGVHVERERGTNTIRIHGAVAQNTPERDCPEVIVTVEHPARFSTSLFVDYLREAGVRVERPRPEPVLKSAEPVHRSVVAEHTSEPLTEILKRLNKSSDNLIAECLLKTVGAVALGKGTSGAEGTG
ncbi:MAG: D-alanyl-D-alanine carboxypeptidase/D-alanyl-D-alanine-endopeptidase, partial [Chloroherpetonaceae bacterium]|nr:D-alanyl-D-alanine carboxypeptidase/D-alanyl-D-alanine-endopeptidase [Chthonomonadaceae bacterium]MDW8208272.1 D-alanyl-D-alanine carboxypeptidase/D-alanyl-D-alanine-endopeptidase [Chloroherpetonaceae bacterium]